MDGQWVTYRDLAVRLGVSVEAARRRALGALEGHIRDLQAQLAAAEGRLEKQAAEVAERDVERLAQLQAEKARTDRAIAAFAAIATSFDALAAARTRPWWRRLAG